MSKDEAITLRGIQKQLKKDLYKLRIKMYYHQQNQCNFSELKKIREVFDYKKNKLLFIRYLRKSLSHQDNMLKEA